MKSDLVMVDGATLLLPLSSSADIVNIAFQPDEKLLPLSTPSQQHCSEAAAAAAPVGPCNEPSFGNLLLQKLNRTAAAAAAAVAIAA